MNTKYKQSFISSLLLIGAVGAASSAQAFSFGELEGAWVNVRISTTVKKNHSINYAAPVYALNNFQIKFDSGKNNCYAALHYFPVSLPDLTHPYYEVINICNVGGSWIWYDYGFLWELADGNLGNDWFSLRFPGGSGAESAAYEGTLAITVSHDKNGKPKSGKVVAPQDGTIAYRNLGNQSYGTAHAGFTLKPVNNPDTQVPALVKACFDDVVVEITSGNGLISGCGAD